MEAKHTATPNKESVLKRGIDSEVFPARSKIITGHAFKKLPGITVGNIEEVTYKNAGKQSFLKRDTKKARLSFPYVVYFVTRTDEIIVLAAGDLDDINNHIESRIRSKEVMRQFYSDDAALAEAQPQAVDSRFAAAHYGSDLIAT